VSSTCVSRAADARAPDAPRIDAKPPDAPVADSPAAVDRGPGDGPAGPDLVPVPDLLGADLSPVKDTDKDGVIDAKDNCPFEYNPGQVNSDNDSRGDLCDNCPADDNEDQKDGDGDLVGDPCDNCPGDNNPSQSDIDKDFLGDACDPDKDGDGLPNDIDPQPDVKDTVLYYEEPISDVQDFDTQGPWSASSASSLCQTNSGDPLSLEATLEATTGPDYLAETEAKVVTLGSGGSLWPALGLVLRFDSGPPQSGYACLVSPTKKRLMLGKWSFLGVWTELKASPDGSVPTAPSYRIRAGAKGSQLSCELLPNGPKLTASDNTFSSGPPGMTTFLMHACFEYFWVVKQ
jgi:hypothetical protein